MIWRIAERKCHIITAMPEEVCVCVCVFFKCVPSRDKKTRTVFIVFSITQTLHLYFWLLDQKQSFVNIYICFNKVRWKNVEFYLPCKLLPRVRSHRVTEVDSNKGFSSVNLKKKKDFCELTDWGSSDWTTAACFNVKLMIFSVYVGLVTFVSRVFTDP